MKRKLGIIGAGVMGQAIMQCVLKKSFLPKEEVGIFDVSVDKLNQMQKEDFAIYSSIQELVNDCEYVLISVKPQHFDSVVDCATFTENNTLISIMAGIKTSTIATKTKLNSQIARVMPNTPCRIGQGVSAVTFLAVNPESKTFIKNLLGCCGQVIEIEENKFDAVTSVSGSGPAYVYTFIDGMIKGGIKGGLSYEQSKTLAINTVIGSAMLANVAEETPDVLTEQVCSKGGTTIEAVKIYKERGLKDVVIAGMDACRKKSEEMSKTL